jgi:signal transduction histidine kinase
VSTPRGERRAPEGRRAPAVGLLPKVLAAFLVVLLLSVAVTMALETRLVRGELAEQTRVLSAEQGKVLDRLLRDEQIRTTQAIEALSQMIRLHDADLHVELLKLVSTVRLTNALEIGDVVSTTDGEVVATSSSRARIADPGGGVKLADTPKGQRVVPLEGGGYGLVYASVVDVLGPEPLLVVAGYPLDDRRADRLRAAAGADEVEIVVDGEVVAATRRDTAEPSGQWRRHGEIQESIEPRRLVRYVGLAAADDWGHEAAVGLVVEDPLAPLDAGLVRTRVLMGALLVVLCGLLAYAVTRLMTRPLHELTHTATAIAGGQLDRSFRAERRDEIGTLAAALERMRSALHSQLTVIRRQADALRDATRRIVGAQDAERRRLAQDLHDGIQQQLVLLRLEVSLARERVREDPDRLDNESVEFARRIDQILDELRATGQALFPSILRDRGLGGALFSLAARSELPIEVTLEPDPLPRLDPEVETGAYFLISEAVTNALKHARAQRIEILVRRGADVLHVEVRDDGAGFDTTQVEASGGLTNMRDRVTALGGTLRVVPTLAEGTRISAELPLTVAGDSAHRALQVEEHGGDPPVEVGLFREAELSEDGIGVLLDRPLRDRQVAGDREVPLARRHQGQDLELPRREPGES